MWPHEYNRWDLPAVTQIKSPTSGMRMKIMKLLWVRQVCMYHLNFFLLYYSGKVNLPSGPWSLDNCTMRALLSPNHLTLAHGWAKAWFITLIYKQVMCGLSWSEVNPLIHYRVGLGLWTWTIRKWLGCIRFWVSDLIVECSILVLSIVERIALSDKFSRKAHKNFANRPGLGLTLKPMFWIHPD